MNAMEIVRRVLLAISAITIVSGIGQVLAPSMVIDLVGGDPAPTAAHFFGIVGMFMVLFGGMLLQALLQKRHQPIPVFWAGLQKLGAFGAVTLAVTRALLGPLSLLVALFDLVSGILILWYWMRIRTPEAAAV